MQEPVLLQAEGDNYDPGCAYTLWITLTFFAGCLAAAMWFAGYRGSDVLQGGIRVFAVPIAVGGIIHAASYLIRTRFRLTVTPGRLTLEQFRLTGAHSMTVIPIDSVLNVHIHGKAIIIETVQGNLVLKNLRNADPDVFWLKLKDVVNRYGQAGIRDRQFHQKNNLKHIAPHKQPEVLPVQHIPQIPFTYQDGTPILPQRLTDEQAEGVFRPLDTEPESGSDAGEEAPFYGSTDYL